MTSHFYAAQRPRGFINETYAHRFDTRAERDRWVEDHQGDGDVNSATLGAFPVSQRDARRIVGRLDWENLNFYDHSTGRMPSAEMEG